MFANVSTQANSSHGCHHCMRSLCRMSLLYIAQSPWQTKGLMLSSFSGSVGLFSAVGIGMAALLKQYPIKFYPGLVSIEVVLAFILVAMSYKLRQRDDIIPIHTLAENYFEKNYILVLQYWKAYNYGSFTCTEA